MTLGNIACKQQKSTGDDLCPLTLKIMDRVIRSPKQRVPVAPQNGPWSNKTYKKLKKTLSIENGPPWSLTCDLGVRRTVMVRSVNGISMVTMVTDRNGPTGFPLGDVKLLGGANL